MIFVYHITIFILDTFSLGFTCDSAILLLTSACFVCERKQKSSPNSQPDFQPPVFAKRHISIVTNCLNGFDWWRWCMSALIKWPSLWTTVMTNCRYFYATGLWASQGSRRSICYCRQRNNSTDTPPRTLREGPEEACWRCKNPISCPHKHLLLMKQLTNQTKHEYRSSRTIHNRYT